MCALRAESQPEPLLADAEPFPSLHRVEAPAVHAAVVIAAGAGRRLRETSVDDDIVKPIAPVLGTPLVVRTLLTLCQDGVARVVVVTGYQGDEVKALVEREPRLSHLSLRFVSNPDWPRQNGLSVLAAREAVGGDPFLLSMADHLYAEELVLTLRRAAREPGELLLAVDRRTGAVADPEDAMWVRLDAADRITDIGKTLPTFDAVDTGVFVADDSLFEALEAERLAREGDCALADGVRRLARQGLARGVDIGEAWWHDVDTRDELLRVERRLRAAARPAETVPAGEVAVSLS